MQVDNSNPFMAYSSNEAEALKEQLFIKRNKFLPYL